MAVVALALGWGVGVLAWSPGRTPLLSILVPSLAFLAPRRHHAFLLACGYCLSCTRHVPAYATSFFDSPIPGLLSWALMGGIYGAVWAVAWTSRNGKIELAMRSLAVFVVLLFPPIAVLSPGHPLVGWGFLLEGWGWLGVAAAMLGTVYSVTAVRAWSWKLVAAILLIASCALFYFSLAQTRDAGAVAGPVYSVNTRFGKPPLNDEQMLERYERVGKIIRQLAAKADGSAEVLVFPETTLGTFDGTFAQLLQAEIIQPARQAGITVVMGMEVRNRAGERYNTVTAYYPDGNRSTVAQRQPAMVSMWAPWRKDGHYSADWLRKNHLELAPGIKAAVTVCYEEYLPGLFLLSLLRERPQLAIAVSNSWAAKSVDLPAIQKTHFEGMARLFGLRMVRAENITPAN